MLYAILAVLLVLIDQAVKFAVRADIGLGQSVPFIPHVLDLAYVQNTGAAFSILKTHTWLLALTSLAVVLVLCWLVLKGFFQNALGRVSAALVLAGGVGNLIDRAVFGFVTDMFRTVFIDFPVFNVADCCVTVGVPLLFLYILLYVGKEEPAARENSVELSDSADRKGSAGRWIAIGAAGAAGVVLLSLCVWRLALVKARQKEGEAGRGKKRDGKKK